jgi:hypothetical protein
MVVLYAYGVPPLMLTFTPGWLSGTSKQDTEDDGAPSGASPQPLRRQPDVRDLQPTEACTRQIRADLRTAGIVRRCNWSIRICQKRSTSSWQRRKWQPKANCA